MSYQEIKVVVGKTGMYSIGYTPAFGSVLINVKIIDARDRGWGIVDFLIEPVSGTGRVWVQQSSIMI